MNRFLLLAAVVSMLTGCDSKHGPAPRAAVAPAPKPTPPPEPKGLGARGNDPKIVELATAALKCPQDGTDLFDFKCEAWKAFRNAKELKDQDATVVSFWEDADPRVRFLGAVALPDGINDHPPFREDKALSVRMVRALAAEPNENVARSMATRVARVNVETTGQLEAIAAIIKERRHAGATRKLVNDLLFTNRGSRATYDYFLTLTHDPEKAVRKEAVDAFWIGGGLSDSETCKMWEEHLEDTEPEIAGESAHHLGMSNNCRPNDGVLIEKLGARIDSKTTGGESDFASGLKELCDDEHATVAHKLDAARLARAMAADPELHSFLRWRGLEAVAACDKKAGRAFVARYTKDKDKLVAEKARETLKAR